MTFLKKRLAFSVNSQEFKVKRPDLKKLSVFLKNFLKTD